MAPVVRMPPQLSVPTISFVTISPRPIGMRVHLALRHSGLPSAWRTRPAKAQPNIPPSGDKGSAGWGGNNATDSRNRVLFVPRPFLPVGALDEMPHTIHPPPPPVS